MDFEKTFQEEKLFYKNRIETVCKALERNNIHSYYANDKKQALDLLIRFISDNKRDGIIGIGDSMTLHQISFFDWLYAQGSEYTIYNPFERLEDGRFKEFEGLPNEWIPTDVYNELHRKVWEKSRKALLSDVFVTGANAVTMDGKIVSVDGVGNRIAAVIYGPYKVIIVVGRNKIVENQEDAISRINNLTTPLNHLRHASKHCANVGKEEREKYALYKLGELPCVQKGHCVDCHSPLCSRHCTMILEKTTGGHYKDRINVIIVNEVLGL